MAVTTDLQTAGWKAVSRAASWVYSRWGNTWAGSTADSMDMRWAAARAVRWADNSVCSSLARWWGDSRADAREQRSVGKTAGPKAVWSAYCCWGSMSVDRRAARKVCNSVATLVVSRAKPTADWKGLWKAVRWDASKADCSGGTKAALRVSTRAALMASSWALSRAVLRAGCWADSRWV